ncbi:MAG: Crp/Fnr family transcriptional regulator [Rhodocyclales bacterium]|nr:Crp/Fnr family transcriptional regulator [Rhodocyclales bacterium]
MVCSDVTLDDLVDFHAGIDDFDYDHDATIFGMGEATEAVYCIRGGAVKMVRADPAVGGRIVRVLKKGDVAGLESAFAERYEHTAVAVGAVRACRIPIAYFRHFVAKHAGLQVRLFEKSQAALREAETWLAELVGGTIPARTRLARLLLRLRIGDGDRIHRFSVNDMATIIGTTPETVSRIVSEFVRQGLVVKGGNSIVSRHFRGDIAALEKISQEA